MKIFDPESHILLETLGIHVVTEKKKFNALLFGGWGVMPTGPIVKNPLNLFNILVLHIL